jgi:hypothetical protein
MGKICSVKREKNAGIKEGEIPAEWEKKKNKYKLAKTQTPAGRQKTRRRTTVTRIM